MILASTLLIIARYCLVFAYALRTTAIKAMGGVGHPLCEKLVHKDNEVVALGRDQQQLQQCSTRLPKCEKIQVSATDINVLANALQ